MAAGSAGGMFSARIKMGQTSPVNCYVKAGGKVYKASQEVKVTVGGCGG
jgi:sulfur-oxidizing protein SoxY